MDYVAYRDSANIVHAHNHGEQRIGRYPVDGLTVESFADDVSDAQRQGDSDPSTAIIAETMKLFGNSGYGRSLTNKENHLDIRYCDEASVGLAVNDPHFRKLDILGDNYYKISKTKKSIKMDLPIKNGFFVYHYVKLRMLEFYYNLTDKFLDRSDYIALSGESVDALIKPELRSEYKLEKCDWFPRDYNVKVSTYDKRTSGLFKTEFEGDGII